MNEMTSCQEYGHDYETDPEDLTLHVCSDCDDWYRD